MLLAIRPDGVAMSHPYAPSPGRGFGDSAERSSLILVFRVKGE